MLTLVASCSVPSVGEIAISRDPDGGFVAHVRICDGSDRVDGLTLYDSDDTTIDVEPVMGLSDRSAWRIGPIIHRHAGMGAVVPDGELTVYGWTRDNTGSLDGPGADIQTWLGLGPGDLMHLEVVDHDGLDLLESTISRGKTADEWFDEACEGWD